jgi:3-oxoadipate enol-lactonase
MKLHHVFDGPEDAPVLVLASSLGTTHAMWDANVDALTRRYRLLRYDHRGHGQSEVPSGPYRIEEMADDVVDLLDELHLRRVSFCGLSLGGAVGMALAAREPARLERLVLCCTSVKFGDPQMWAERAATVRANGTEAIADATMERWFSTGFREREPDVVAGFRAMLAASPDDGYAACCEAIGEWDFRDRIGAIEVPTQVIAGSDDPATPVEQLELIADSIPHARLHVLEAAHLANVEQPAAFAQAILGEE